MSAGSILSSTRECRRIKELINQLRTLGWENVSETDPEFSKVVLVHRAIDDREYCLTVRIGPTFPDPGSVALQTDDVPPNHAWFNTAGAKSGKTFSLIHLYTEFVRQITLFGPVRRALRDIDNHSWVVDPPPPVNGLRHGLYRRIVVSRGVSLQVILDPNDLSSLPDLKFLGPECKVHSLRQSLARNHHNYDPDYSVIQNIERVLDLELPSGPPDDVGADEMNMGDGYDVDCGICYSFKLGTAIPDKSCDQNPKCGRLFHAECLLEWIRSDPDHRTSFQTFFGKCPYCDTQISCQMS